MTAFTTSPLLTELGIQHELRQLAPREVSVRDFGASQVRTVWDDRNWDRVDDLCEAYASGIAVSPMIVEEIKLGGTEPEYALLAGNHRLRALGRLNGSGPDVVEVFVVTQALSDLDRLAIGVRENEGGSMPLMRDEKATILRLLREHKPKLVAERLGLEYGYVKRVLDDVSLEKDLKLLGVKRAVNEKKVTRVFRAAIKNAAAQHDVELGNRVNAMVGLIEKDKIGASDCGALVKAVTAAGRLEDQRKVALTACDDAIAAASTRASGSRRRVKGERSITTLDQSLRQVDGFSPNEWSKVLAEPDLRTVAERIRTAIVKASGC